MLYMNLLVTINQTPIIDTQKIKEKPYKHNTKSQWKRRNKRRKKETRGEKRNKTKKTIRKLTKWQRVYNSTSYSYCRVLVM